MPKKEEQKSASVELVHAETIPGPPANPEVNPEALIKHALDQKVPIDVIERLMTLRKELKAEYAEKMFHESLAAFQAECPEIKKTKEVKTKGGQVAYRFAPLDSIVSQVKGLLQKHGFSYRMEQELLVTGVKVTCTAIHRDGHSKMNSMEVPLGEGTQIMNKSQIVAAASTFAKRYAFCNAFGIMTTDEDTDGATPDSGDVKQDVKSNVQQDVKPFDPATDKLDFGKKHPGKIWKDVPKDYLEWVIKDYNNPDAKDKAAKTLEYLRAHANDLPEEISSAILEANIPKDLEEWAKTEKVSQWHYHPEFIKRYNAKMEELTGKKQPDELPF